MDNSDYANTAGARQAVLPVVAAALLFGVSFGVVATSAGLGLDAALAMSATSFGGAAQVAAVGVLASGGGAPSAVLTGSLLNLRYLPMGLAAAPSYRGSWWARGAQAQLLGDEAWALSRATDGRHDARTLLHTGALVYVAWLAGTALGVAALREVDLEAWGLDMVSPAIFVALLWGRLADSRHRRAAIASAAVCLLLVPFTPAGVPIAAATLVCLAGLAR